MCKLGVVEEYMSDRLRLKRVSTSRCGGVPPQTGEEFDLTKVSKQRAKISHLDSDCRRVVVGPTKRDH